MADNSQAGLAVGVGDVFASDDIAGVKWARAKVTWGVDGVAVDASATNPLPTTGAKTNNGAVPGTDNIGVLAGIANAAAPTRTEGNQGALRTTLSGDLAITLDGETVGLAAGAAVIGALTANQSVNVAQVGGTNTVNGGVAGVQAVGGNVANAVAATANPVPVGGIFTTAPATLTTGQTATMQFTAAQNLKHDITTIAGTAPTTVGKLDVKGADGDVFVRQATAANLNATVVGTKTNNNAAPGALNVGTLPGVATAAAPSSTEGNQVAASLNLTGDQRCISKISDGTTTAAVIAGTLALKTDLSSVSGTATVTAAAGVLKVGIVGNANGAIDAAMAAAVPANGIHIGGKAAIANPTNATAGNLTPFMLDKAGRVVFTPGNVRENIGVQQTAVPVTTETTIITAGGAGVFNDLTGLIISTTNLIAATITIKDAVAGTTRMVLNYPNAALAPGAPLVLNFWPPIPQAVAASAWTATISAAATSVNVTATFVKNL